MTEIVLAFVALSGGFSVWSHNKLMRGIQDTRSLILGKFREAGPEAAEKTAERKQIEREVRAEKRPALLNL